MWVDVTWGDIWEESGANKASMKAGTVGKSDDGSLWQYLQANAAIAKGDILMKHVNTGLVAALSGTADTVSAIGARRIYLANTFTAANLKGNWFDGDPSDGSTKYHGVGHSYWITIRDSTGAGQVGYIYNRESTGDYVDAWIISSTTGALDVALAATSVFEVYCRTLVVKCAAVAANIPVGVAQKAVTSGVFFWGLVKGPGIVHWDTSESALDATNMLIIPSANEAGAAGGASSTATTAQHHSSVGKAMSTDVTGDGMIAAEIDVLRHIVPENTLLVPDVFTREWPRRK